MSREYRDVLLLSFTYFTRINIDCNRHRHEHNETRKRNKQTVRTQTNENIAHFFHWHSVIVLRRRYNFPRVLALTQFHSGNYLDNSRWHTIHCRMSFLGMDYSRIKKNDFLLFCHFTYREMEQNKCCFTSFRSLRTSISDLSSSPWSLIVRNSFIVSQKNPFRSLGPLQQLTRILKRIYLCT